jgi:hypothetical protein
MTEIEAELTLCNYEKAKELAELIEVVERIVTLKAIVSKYYLKKSNHNLDGKSFKLAIEAAKLIPGEEKNVAIKMVIDKFLQAQKTRYTGLYEFLRDERSKTERMKEPQKTIALRGLLKDITTNFFPETTMKKFEEYQECIQLGIEIAIALKRNVDIANALLRGLINASEIAHKLPSHKSEWDSWNWDKWGEIKNHEELMKKLHNEFRRLTVSF